ncbi:MAG: DUF5676 family membrane protein [Bauldia sp.]
MSMTATTRELSSLAAGTALAITLAILFVVCVIAAFVAPNLQLSHAWISLFTAAPMTSARAWIEGLLASVILGWVAGWLFALTYNAVAARQA